MITLKCTRNLFHPLNPHTAAFLKDQIYVNAFGEKFTENTRLINELGEPHIVGNWKRHFKQIKNK